MEKQNIFVTGAKRGLGLGLVKAYAENPNISFIFAASRV